MCHFPEEQGEEYANGTGVDPVGGVEAIISHYISKELKIPCAHAPAFSNYTIDSKVVDTRCSAEYITPTFLPCILIGLSQAPQITQDNIGINRSDIDFLIVPYNAIGGIPVIEISKMNKKIYAIKENFTILDVTPKNFNAKCVTINTYEELLELI